MSLRFTPTTTPTLNLPPLPILIPIKLYICPVGRLFILSHRNHTTALIRTDGGDRVVIGDGKLGEVLTMAAFWKLRQSFVVACSHDIDTDVDVGGDVGVKEGVMDRLEHNNGIDPLDAMGNVIEDAMRDATIKKAVLSIHDMERGVFEWFGPTSGIDILNILKDLYFFVDMFETSEKIVQNVVSIVY